MGEFANRDHSLEIFEELIATKSEEPDVTEKIIISKPKFKNWKKKWLKTISSILQN